MRITSRKKTILGFYAPESLAWVTSEAGAPPLDVSGVAYLLHGTSCFDKTYQLESTRRTLEAMVKDGLLERVTVYERRQDKTQGSGDSAGVRCKVSRYGLPGKCAVVRDSGGSISIEGEWSRVE